MSKLVWHQLALFGVLAFLTALRLATGRVGLELPLVWWWLGGIVGFLFVFADRLVYAFMSHPEETLSIKIKELLGRGKIINGLALALSEREKQDRLMMRSVLFIIVWAILAVLTMTSVADLFSRGFMLGLGTHLIFDLAWDYWSKGRRDVELWFWQVRNVSKREMDIFVWASFGFYLITIWYL